MLEIVLTSPESDQYSSAPKEISKFPLMYMTGYFCRSVYINHFHSSADSRREIVSYWQRLCTKYWLTA